MQEEAFVYERPARPVNAVFKIRNVYDSQVLKLKNTLMMFFDEDSVRNNYMEEATQYPDFRTMNVALIVVVFYIWSQRGQREIPKKWNFSIAPNAEIQKILFEEQVSTKIKADIVRYMRYMIDRTS